jgi:hypothetical protein
LKRIVLKTTEEQYRPVAIKAKQKLSSAQAGKIGWL